MKRKLIYTIIFISIFLMSTTSMIQPAQGYEPPDIPDEAKNMILDDTEVVAYDEDEMEDSMGSGFKIKDIKNGDADIVGARSQMKILDWETDEDLVDYEEDFLYPGGDIENSFIGVRATFWDMGNVTQLGTPPIAELIKQLTIASSGGDPTADALATGVDTLADASILTWADLMVTYGNSYDGTILEREIWDLLDPAEEFDDSDPDVDDDEVPYLLDPRDWRSAQKNGAALRDYVLGTADTMQAATDNWYGYLSTQPVIYAALNTTVTFAPGNAMKELRWNLDNITLGAGLPNPDYPLGMYILTTYITQNVWYQITYGFPDKLGLLLLLLEAGQPCCGPTADFIKRAVKEFRLKEGPWRVPWIQYGDDWLGLLGAPGADGAISSIPYGTVYMGLGGMVPVPMGGETIYVYAEEVSVEVDDAGTVLVEFEYYDGQLDPKDIVKNLITPGSEDDPNELDDWEWIFPKGSDGDTIMKDGDNVFYQTHPMEGPIPGYEVTIIVGVSLVSVIGLVYVIMRKRKK